MLAVLLFVSSASSLDLIEAQSSQELDQLVHVEALTCDGELDNLFGVNWLLALLLVHELDFILLGGLDVLGAHGLQLGFQGSEVQRSRVSQEPEGKAWANKDHTLLLIFQILSKLRHKGEVNCGTRLFRSHEVVLALVLEQVLDLQIEYLLVLHSSQLVESLVVLEELVGSLHDVSLSHFPCVTQVLQQIPLFIQHFNGSLLGHVIESDDAI